MLLNVFGGRFASDDLRHGGPGNAQVYGDSGHLDVSADKLCPDVVRFHGYYGRGKIFLFQGIFFY